MIMNPYRRKFMKRAGLCGLGAAVYLTGCGGDSEQTGQDAATADAQKDADPCSDLSALTAAQIQIRDTFGYVDSTDDPDMVCRVCELWTPPSPTRCRPRCWPI